MPTTRFWKFRKKIILLVSITALILIFTAALLNLQASEEMRSLVAEQFNQEQLVIARHIGRSIEKELNFFKTELSLLNNNIRAHPFRSKAAFDRVQETLSHITHGGVSRIEIIDRDKKEIYLFRPNSRWSVLKTEDEALEALKKVSAPDIENTRISQPIIDSGGIHLILAVALSNDPAKQLLLKVNVSRFLAPFMKNVRSGKTGYAWIIDGNGTFLFHPETEFVGQNAFEARKAKGPDIPFKIINMIQKQKMLKGFEGTGWYFSGWHRGLTGNIKKLIAYCPAFISDRPPQKWAVAVVAPVSEIEDALKKGSEFQLLLQGFVILVIFSSAGMFVFFLTRWSHFLEKTVEERTSDLKKSEEKYRSLVESAEDFIFTVAVDGRLQSVNSFTANFFGGPPEYFNHKPLTSLFPDDVAEKQIRLIRLVYTHGKSIRDEFEIGMEENKIWISANFMPIKNEAGEISAILCIARDITENKNLEKQLVNTEKLASLGTLAAGVAHEVNNPLGVILGFCDLLLQKTDPHSRTYEDLKTIERQGLHCKEVVENLLSFARLGQGDYEYTDLNHCLREIIKVVNHTLQMNDIELVTDLGGNLPLVRGEFRQLQQVFLNLINNGVAAMNGGGLLRIRTGFDKNRRKAVVEIKDNGCGIRSEDMDRIFEPFFTTKPEGEGTGLGLFVSYGIVTKFGGSIECSSSRASTLGKQKGTVFTVRLAIKTREGE